MKKWLLGLTLAVCALAATSLTPSAYADITYSEIASITGSSRGQLVFDSSGNAYGTTFSGASPNTYGTVYKIAPSGEVTILKGFTTSGISTDGAFLDSSLCLVGDYLYGSTIGGGSGNLGTFFRLTTAGSGFTVLRNFNGSNGSEVVAAPQRITDTFIVGSAYSGGTYNKGVIFAVTNGSMGWIASLDGTNGLYTRSSPIMAPDGWLYGTALSGGAHNYGTIYRISTNGTSLSAVYHFTNNTDGGNSAAPLLRARNGYLYGTTTAGSDDNAGTVFRFNTTNNVLTTIYRFHNYGYDMWPHEIIEGVDGYYGTTGYGGANDVGLAYRVTDDGQYKRLYSFPQQGSGEFFYANGPAWAKNGTLWGTSRYGGTTVYQLSIPMPFEIVSQIPTSGGTVYGLSPTVAGQTYKLWGATNLTDKQLIGSTNATGTYATITDTNKYTHATYFGEMMISDTNYAQIVRSSSFTSQSKDFPGSGWSSNGYPAIYNTNTCDTCTNGGGIDLPP